jgi:peroxiredoxin Q/BCP
MAQLRRDYAQFVARDAEVIIVGPEERDSFLWHWQQGGYPFVGLSDPDHTVADLYGQEVSRLKFGRMPALFVIDKHGQIRYRHYGNSMRDIPRSEAILALLDVLNKDDGQPQLESASLS